MFKFFSTLRFFDVPLFVAMLLLQVLGLTVLYGTSLGGDSLIVFWRQLLFVGLGLILFFIFAFYNYHNLGKANKLVYLIALVLLVFVLVFTGDVRGSSRWIDLGPFKLQPAEFTKLAVVLVLARWFSLKEALISSWKALIVTLGLTLVPFVLVLVEPDLGSSLVIFGVWVGMLLISPVSKKQLAILALAFVVVAGIGWQFMLHDYQKHRVEVFLNPASDPQGKGYNVRQAQIAVGSGQFLGQGLGKGLQSQLKFLPERQTDFIFAAAAEETGLLGTSVFVGLYGWILLRLLRIIQMSKDLLGRYIVMGVFCIFLAQIVINIGMNLGIAPVTGIPLPFLSAGGSALFVSCIALGIAQNIYVQSKSLRF